MPYQCIGKTANSISLIAALLLSIESYLTLHGKSLCSTSACEIVSHYLAISEPLVITLGAGFFWFLTLLFFFAQRYPQQIGYLPYCFLITALAVDGTLIGFQFFTIQQKCPLCISVATALLILSILYCLAHKSYLLLFCCLLTWTGAFATNSILKMHPPSRAGSQMIFFQKNSLVDSKPNQTINTLIFSMECPHCLEIISTLAEANTNNITWQFASIDNNKVSLMKLSKFLKEAPQAVNPFRLLKQIKQDSIENYEISTTVQKSTGYTADFLSNLGISTIPVLIIDNSMGKKQIILGTANILQAISSQK